MTEFTAQQTKDVQLMNVAFTVGDLLEKIGTEVKNAGLHLTGVYEDESSSDEEKKMADHLLHHLANALAAINKGIEINDIGWQLSRIEDGSLSDEDAKALKDQTEGTEPIQRILAILTETADQTLMRNIAEALDLPPLSREELDMLSGK